MTPRGAKSEGPQREKGGNSYNLLRTQSTRMYTITYTYMCIYEELKLFIVRLQVAPLGPWKGWKIWGEGKVKHLIFLGINLQILTELVWDYPVRGGDLSFSDREFCKLIGQSSNHPLNIFCIQWYVILHSTLSARVQCYLYVCVHLTTVHTCKHT